MFRFLIPTVAFLSITTGATAQSAGDGENEALREARRAYELIEELSPRNDMRAASATLEYGRNLQSVYELAKSRKVLKAALKSYKSLYGKNSPELIPVLLLLAQANASYPPIRPNRRYLNQARKIAKARLDNTSIEFADQMLAIGQVSLYDPPPDVAETDIRSAYEIYLTTLEPTAKKLGEAEYALGRYYMRRNELDEAAPHLQSALRIFDPSDVERFAWHFAVRIFWGGSLESLGLRDQSTVHYVEMGRLRESSAGEKLLPLYRVAPYYPADALNAGISGYVDWEYSVDESGYVVEPEVIHIEGTSSFEKASLDALLKFRYPPRFIDGQAVATHGITNRITFMLQD